MKKTITSETSMKALKTIRKDGTINDRLEMFRSTLKTSDIIIAKHMGLGVSSVSSHMPSNTSNGRSISTDWLNKFAEAFPFIDKSYMLDGKGEMFKGWSSTEQVSFVHSTEWYKSKDKTTTKPDSVYASKAIVDKALKDKPFLEILIDIYQKSFGSGRLKTEVNIEICERIRKIRESQNGRVSGSKCTQEDFARMMNVTRSMIVSIELKRQSPSLHFIRRLGEDFSNEPGMGLKQNGKSVRVSYDWLFDGKGEMFQLHDLEVDDDKEHLKEDNKELKETIKNLNYTLSLIQKR